MPLAERRASNVHDVDTSIADQKLSSQNEWTTEFLGTTWAIYHAPVYSAISSAFIHDYTYGSKKEHRKHQYRKSILNQTNGATLI